MAHVLGTIRDESIPIERRAGSIIELRDVPRSDPPPSIRDSQEITAATPEPRNDLSKRQAALLILQLTFVELLSSVSNGLLTVSIPRMAEDLQLPQHLIYWPSSVFGLVCGSCLLLAGSVADVIGSRPVNLAGNLLLGCFNLASGLARTGEELIAFRALIGLALALYLPSSVGVLTNAIANGRTRNIGFACSGVAQCVGFAIGLVLGGIFIQTVGWRAGYYLCGSGQLLLFMTSFWILPKSMTSDSLASKWQKLKHDIDWVGAGIASTSLAMLAYVLVSITTDVSYIKQGGNIAILTISLVLIPTFIFWVARQERLAKPALIPNSIWKSTAFTSTCIMVLSMYAMVQTMELFSSLFFQQVQHLSALQTSLRFLPSVLLGGLINLTIGLVVHKISAFYLILVTSLLSTGAPLLMALIQPQWPYWFDAFPAQCLMPLGVDVMFTVGLLIVSDVFPARTQALAGAVFNTVAQFGMSIGLAIAAVVSSTVTQKSEYENKRSGLALLVGYRAGFWAVFAWMLAACVVGGFGLRKIGKVGLKKD